MKKIALFLMLLPFSLHLCVFSSPREVTRLEFISYVMSGLGAVKSEKSAGFLDLSESDPYYPYASVAKEHGVVSGYPGNLLKPYAKITREDALVILARAYGINPVSDIYLKNCTDYSEISGYSRGYISAIVQKRIIDYSPKDGLKPKEYIEISEVETLFSAFKKYIDETMHFSFGYPKVSENKTYNAITIKIKLSRPSSVYYKLVPASNYLGGFRPDKEELTTFLTAVSTPETELDVNIYPEDLGEYNLYIAAVDNEGNYTAVEFLENLSSHRYQSGDGSEKKPYRIYTQEQLEGIKYYPSAHFSLEEDIQIQGEWSPITIEDTYIGFNGSFNGNFHRITNLNIDSHDKNSGLFSVIYGAKIKNLYVEGTVFGQENSGIIAGVSEGGDISSCFVTGRVMASGNNAGAVVGVNNGRISDTVAACYMVEAGNYAGGICGKNTGEITNTLSSVYTVSADMYASGISGVNLGGRITSSVAASIYATDIITTKSGRITTNKQNGTSSNNYCFDKMMSSSGVNFGIDTQDGLEVSWDELTSLSFYKDTLGWDFKDIWDTKITEDYRFPLPKGIGIPDMIKGITMYAPIKISTEKELREVYKNPDMHYILTNDIAIHDRTKWEMIGSTDADAEDAGFNGTFDGNNHTISGLYITSSDDTVYGMFGVISAGTVRNLKLINVDIEAKSLAGGLVGINHGYIENCQLSGRIYAEGSGSMLSCGGVVGNNYGYLENVTSNMQILTSGQVLTIGGICANNEGYIYSADFTGKLAAREDMEHSNAVAGGICGINTSGVIYDSYSDPEITARASVNYSGGIAGIINGGEIYKTSSTGKINISSDKRRDSFSYSGGIAGLSPEGLIMNSFSYTDISVTANNAYTGGITGFNQYASIQNCYSRNNLAVKGEIYSTAQNYTGGICGFSEAGFISDNAVLLKDVDSNGLFAGVSNNGSDMVFCQNNYIADTITQDSSSQNGTPLEYREFIEDDFFFKPISDGGRLGWNSQDVWYIKKWHSLPLLQGVKNQDNFR